MGLIVFSQQVRGAVFLFLAQVVFSSGLRGKLALCAPDVDSSTIAAAGATAVRNGVPLILTWGAIALQQSVGSGHVPGDR